MDLLTGYGSASDADSGASDVPEPVAPSAVPPASSGPPEVAQQLSNLPQPSQNKKPLFSGIPLPARKRRRLVAKFSCPIDFGEIDLPDSDGEEDAGAGGAGGSKAANDRDGLISELLPAPRNAKDGARGRLEVDARVGSAGGEAEYAAEPHAAPEPMPMGNEAYRVGAVPQYTVDQQYGYDAATGQYTSVAPNPAKALGANPSIEALEAAVAAEQARIGASAGGIQFKEVSGAELRYMDPAARAEASALRSALGGDYEQRLKSEAGKVGEINKLAKRKHQLASLFVQAKAQELDDMEKVRWRTGRGCVVSLIAWAYSNALA